ncbi:MAG: family efflux transporter, subunit [Hydrocarboniphaga sp.]|uniref:efflux RND transporter periplasmic adaptor subunit n=1 Tax=Hydrocarboniphaga sp. TaxID=2033016 RepID=UPI00260957F3|nr:efflux RND transporter periplasmic adaptor subunit [Hydrocarboniphaga sp.]MDB5968581.1 family efflux transporter, subunit [Hydrocarboniphaga sp.]
MNMSFFGKAVFSGAIAALFMMTSVTANAQGDRPAAAVETSRAALRDLAPAITATGQVQSRSGADMAAGIAGPIDFVAEPGTRVLKNQVIARIDTGEIRLQRAEQAARVTRSELALKQSDRELERLKASGNAVSRFQLDQSENTRDLAVSDLEIARATLRQTDDRLARAEVRAPFAGVIAERVRREGEEVARGDAVARLQDTEHLELRLFLPLRHVRAIAPGSTVQVRLDDNRVVAGKVRAIVPVGDARSQSFETLIDLPAEEAELAVGRTLQVVLPLAAVQKTLAVPRDAVVIRSDGLSVYVVRNDKAERVAVKTGSADGDWVAVQGALAAQDAVVVRGAETLHDGDPVKIIGEHKTWNTGSGLNSGLSQP